MTKRISKQTLWAAVGTVVLATATAVYAQTLPKNQAEFEKMVGITAAQKAKMKEIEARYKPQMQTIDGKYRPQLKALQTQIDGLVAKQRAIAVKAQTEMKPIAEKANKEVEAVFTPAQRAKIKQIQQQAMSQRQGGGGMPGGGMPMGGR